MKQFPSHRLIFKSLLLASLLASTQCGKKDESTSAPPAAPASPAPAPSRPPSLVDHAEKLGFVSKLPKNTEFYAGSVSLKAHLANLKNSAWWKEVNAVVEDKTPAPTAGDKTFATMEKLWGGDFFIAGGRGFSAAAMKMRNLNRAYNEIYFKMLMTGGTASALGGGAKDGSKPNPLLYLQMFLQDPSNLEKVAHEISALELPPLLAGFKVEDPDAVLATLGDTKALEEKKIFVMSELTTPQGNKFRVATLDPANAITEADQKNTLSRLPANTPEAARQVLDKALSDLRSKKFKLAWGKVDGYVILACGQNLDHLTFAASPAESLLAKTEFNRSLPHVGKNLAALCYMNADSLRAINDDQPVVPMLRGVISAMQENPMFKSLGDALGKQVAELSGVESKVYSIEATDLVAVAWWDRGLKAEITGGITPKFLLPGKPLRFRALVDKPGVIFALDYHRNLQHAQVVRDWTERLIGIAYTAAQELIKAGIAGPQGGQTFAMFNVAVLPTIKSLYQADKDMDEKGLGSETAYILDVNGKVPNLPGAPPELKDMKLPRLTSVSDVASRAELAKGWKTMNETITNIVGLVALLNPQQSPDGQAKPPFVVPQPQSSQSGDMTTWYYDGEYMKGDLSPCASISDQLLVLSTSRPAAEGFAAELAAPAGEPVEGAVWRLDLGAAAEWVAKASALNPSTTPEKAKEMQQALRWIKPFHALEGHVTQEKGQWRVSLDWEMTDVVKFD